MIPLFPLLCFFLCLVVSGCGQTESVKSRRIVSVSIQGYSLGDVLSEQAQATLFDPEDPHDVSRVHRVSDTGRLPRIMLDPRGQICQGEGTQLTLEFDDGPAERFTEGDGAEKLFKVMASVTNTSVQKSPHAATISLEDGILLVRAQEFETYPLFGWHFYRRENYVLVGFTLKNELHRQTLCGTLK